MAARGKLAVPSVFQELECSTNLSANSSPLWAFVPPSASPVALLWLLSQERVRSAGLFYLAGLGWGQDSDWPLANERDESDE